MRRPHRSTRTDTSFPYTTLSRSGKQASQTLIRINPTIAPGRLVARLDIDSDQRLYGTVAAGPAAGLLKLQFPSLADTGLKPDKDKSRLHLEDAGDASNIIDVKIAYKLAPSAANPGFPFSQVVKTLVDGVDATGTGRTSGVSGKAVSVRVVICGSRTN